MYNWNMISPNYFFWESPYAVEFFLQIAAVVLLFMIAKRLAVIAERLRSK